MKTKYIFEENNECFDEYEVKIPEYLTTDYYKDRIKKEVIIKSKKELVFKFRGTLYEVTREPYEMYINWSNYPYCTRLLIFNRLNFFLDNKLWSELKIEIESNLRLKYIKKLA
jgi:hypothetical protein